MFGALVMLYLEERERLCIVLAVIVQSVGNNVALEEHGMKGRVTCNGNTAMVKKKKKDIHGVNHNTAGTRECYRVSSTVCSSTKIEDGNTTPVLCAQARVLVLVAATTRVFRAMMGSDDGNTEETVMNVQCWYTAAAGRECFGCQ